MFGGGKTIRESMGQGTASRADGAPDLVITNAVVLDHAGIVKADVGVRDGRIVALGKAGNPDVMDGVHPALRIGASTEIVAGEGRILTAGAIDCHVHLITPTILDEALATGVTTVIGGGTGPTEGTRATTCSPGEASLTLMHRALDDLPLNVVLLGKGNTVSAEALQEQVLAGAGGFKLHEDWGSTPGGDRRVPARVRARSACRRRSTPTRSTRPATWRARWRRSAAAASTPTTRRAPAAGTRRTSSRSPRTRTCCRPRPTRRARTRSTRSTSTSTC